jgi:hypothetical protein
MPEIDPKGALRERYEILLQELDEETRRTGERSRGCNSKSAASKRSWSLSRAARPRGPFDMTTKGQCVTPA